MSNLFVCLLGMGTVFLGLICIIALCKISSFLCSFFSENTNKETSSDAKSAPVAPIANKQEIIAAVCAVVAEECDTDIKNIKVVSFKKA